MENIVNPEIILWARERLKYGYHNLPKEIRSDRLKDWESGSIQPTYSQLETLAKHFRLPIAVFFPLVYQI